jgi:putative endopeptidase
MSLQDEVSPELKPGNDFYRYVNEKWLKAHPIPDDKSRVAAFTVLNDENIERLKALLEAPDNPKDSPNTMQAKALYRSAMDEATIEENGIDHLRPVLDRIAQLDGPKAIKDFIASWHGHGLRLLWRADRDVDDKDSQRYLARILQSGLGLPDRDYYFEQGEQFDTARDGYRKFISELFGLLGLDNPEQRAKSVYSLEEKLAKASSTALEQRDPDASYNIFDHAELKTAFPSLDWADYLNTIGFGKAKEIVISQPNFLKVALALLESEDLETWRNYITAQCLLPLMTTLPNAYDRLYFNFYGKVLSGAKEPERRYRCAINMCMGILPEPTGRLFTEAHFDEPAKQTIIDLVGHLQAILKERIKELPWMSEPTKKAALNKLATFMPLLGYPDKWRDFTDLKQNNSYVENVMAIQRFNWNHDASLLMETVDRTEWLMSPAMVNAYYWPNTNGITFPAGILQPPFFDAKGDFAANYGGIGVVIGHEITHGFDDEGSKFDLIGNLKSWWTEGDRASFDERTKRLIDQYNNYEIEGRHVNGALTLGENIADLGGAIIAFGALRKYLQESGQNQLIDGFTPEQRFFMSYARTWRENERPERALQSLVSDPHSPASLRVNGVVTNLDAFYEAFDIKPTEALYQAPDERVRIW